MTEPTNHRSRFRRLIAPAIMLLAGAIGGVGMAELGARAVYNPFQTKAIIEHKNSSEGYFKLLSDPELPYIIETNKMMEACQPPLLTNRLGMNDFDRYTEERDPTKKRILWIGDSVSYGAGARREFAPAKLLETELNTGPGTLEVINLNEELEAHDEDNFPSLNQLICTNRSIPLDKGCCQPGYPQSVEVLNGAVPGYDLIQITRYLEVFGPKLKPDAVIYGYCLNDPGDDFQRTRKTKDGWVTEKYTRTYYYDNDLVRKIGLSPHFSNTLLENSYLYALIQSTAAKWRIDHHQTEFVNTYTTPFDKDITYFKRMKEATDKMGARFYVTSFPFLDFELGVFYPHKDNHAAVQDLCDMIKVPHIDLLPAIRYHSGEQLRSKALLPTDVVHPGAFGYLVLMQRFVQEFWPHLGEIENRVSTN